MALTEGCKRYANHFAGMQIILHIVTCIRVSLKVFKAFSIVFKSMQYLPKIKK